METLQKENTRIKKYFEFSKELGREVENTSFSAEFLNERDNYYNLAKSFNSEMDEKSVKGGFVFNNRKYSIEWQEKQRELKKKVNDLYNNLEKEIKDANIGDVKYIISKRRLKKLNQVRYWMDGNIYSSELFL